MIDADLYVPAGVNAAARAPAILATNGFGGTKADQADFAQGLGELGYVTLSYTGGPRLRRRKPLPDHPGRP